MPWIDIDKCNGCGDCVARCRVGALTIFNSKAFINMAECRFCNNCMDGCSREAIRPDSERVAAVVAENRERIRQAICSCAGEAEKVRREPERLRNLVEYFRMQQTAARLTLSELAAMEKTLF